jgi:hypothetical protein
MGATRRLLVTVTVVVVAETHRAGRAFIDGVFQARLGLRGTRDPGTPPTRRRVGAEVSVVHGADGG